MRTVDNRSEVKVTKVSFLEWTQTQSGRKFSKAGNTKLDISGSDSYQQLNSWWLFFTSNQMKYIHLSICRTLNYFPASLIIISPWAVITDGHNRCLFCPDLIRTPVMWCIGQRFSIFKYFLWSPRDLQLCRNQISLRKFPSILLPPKCTWIKLPRTHQNGVVLQHASWGVNSKISSGAISRKAFHPLKWSCRGWVDYTLVQLQHYFTGHVVFLFSSSCW